MPNARELNAAGVRGAALNALHSRANMARVRQSRPDSGLGFQLKVALVLIQILVQELDGAGMSGAALNTLLPHKASLALSLSVSLCCPLSLLFLSPSLSLPLALHLEGCEGSGLRVGRVLGKSR